MGAVVRKYSSGSCHSERSEGSVPMFWYVAHTRHFREELKVRDLLCGMGVDCFVPTVKRRKTRGSGMYEAPAVPNLVFVHAGRKAALELVNVRCVPMSYLRDCATRTLMVVGEKEMDSFRRVLEASIEEGGLVDRPLAVGDKVRVVKGPLQGVEGNVLELQGKYYVVVGICGLLYARARIPRAWMERIDE